MSRIALPIFLTAAMLLTARHLPAQVATTPVGFVTVAIKPSPNGTAFSVTQFSAPLQTDAVITGQAKGRITAVGSNTLTSASAGWQPGQLAVAGSPYFARITSGAAAGRILEIQANDATTLTLNTQGSTLSGLGITTGTNGDTYEIFPGYTLLKLVGTPSGGIIGGTSANYSAGQTDKLLINDASGVTRFYYYDTQFSQWRRPGSSASQNNLVISPYTGLAIYRISTTPLSFLFSGAIPNTAARTIVPTTGTTLYATYFPISTTLAALSMNTLPGWRKLTDPGVTLDSTDRVLMEDASGVLRSYYFDGTNWKRAGSSAIQDTTALPAGSTIYVTRFGSPTGAETWLRPLPYNL